MYVYMHVSTKSFLKSTTNSLCVRAHLANKADSDSEYSSGSMFSILFCCLSVCCHGNIINDLYPYLKKKKHSDELYLSHSQLYRV